MYLRCVLLAVVGLVSFLVGPAQSAIIRNTPPLIPCFGVLTSSVVIVLFARVQLKKDEPNISPRVAFLARATFVMMIGVPAGLMAASLLM